MARGNRSGRGYRLEGGIATCSRLILAIGLLVSVRTVDTDGEGPSPRWIVRNSSRMRRAPDRPWPLQILILFAGFLAGPLASLRLSMELAPGSELVQTVSGFLFALAFVAASLAWTGVGFVSAAFSTIRQLVRSGRITPVTAQPGERLVPAGYGAYVLFSTAAGFVIGLLAGVATELRLAPAVLAWTALGAAYGIALWAAAHHGFLPFLEPE